MGTYTTINDALSSRSLTEIPSEFIEPYLQAMLSVELECIEFRPTEEQVKESKANLKGIERFVDRFCGIHARYATMNTYYAFYDMTLEDFKKLLKREDEEIEEVNEIEEKRNRDASDFDYGMNETHDNY